MISKTTKYDMINLVIFTNLIHNTFNKSSNMVHNICIQPTQQVIDKHIDCNLNLELHNDSLKKYQLIITK